MCVEDVLYGVSRRCSDSGTVNTHLLTQALERRIELLPASEVFVHQKIQQVDCLDHAIEGRQVALGGRDVVPARLASNPDFNAAILRLAVGEMRDIVDDNALRSVVRIENWRMRVLATTTA